MIYAHIDDAKNYSGLGEAMVWALNQLARPDLKDLPVGKTVLTPGKAWFSIEELETKPAAEVPFEAHREFVDVQMTLQGDERIGCAPVSRLVPAGIYNADEDIQYFRGEGLILDCTRGMFAVFFPGDGHQPCTSPSGSGTIKKIVVKIHKSLIARRSPSE
jgi:biofilm protein TabA